MARKYQKEIEYFSEKNFIANLKNDVRISRSKILRVERATIGVSRSLSGQN
jgi:hypothetical protein